MKKMEINMENIILVIADSLGVDKKRITPETKLVDLDVDMRTLVDLDQLILDFSFAFDVSIPDDVLEQFVIVQDVVNALILETKEKVLKSEKKVTPKVARGISRDPLLRREMTSYYPG